MLDRIMEESELEEPIHTMPLFGRAHTCSRECWCHPEVVNYLEVMNCEHNAFIFSHNVSH